MVSSSIINLGALVVDFSGCKAFRRNDARGVGLCNELVILSCQTS
jgi:hypothetical protein